MARPGCTTRIVASNTAGAGAVCPGQRHRRFGRRQPGSQQLIQPDRNRRLGRLDVRRQHQQPGRRRRTRGLRPPCKPAAGITQTLASLSGSPAIDAGAATIVGVNVPMIDQRGALRGPAGLNAGPTVDIGAYEASSSYLVSSTADTLDVGTIASAVGWANVNANVNPANLRRIPLRPTRSSSTRRASSRLRRRLP